MKTKRQQMIDALVDYDADQIRHCPYYTLEEALTYLYDRFTDEELEAELKDITTEGETA